MLATDTRAKWDGRIVTDPRATHYWDENRVVGTWYAEQRGLSSNAVEWDTYYLYGPESQWGEDGIDPPHIETGHTIFGDREALEAAIVPLLEN